jgi:hypothetical protein
VNTSKRIHYVRILVAGFLAEALVFAAVIPVLIVAGQRPLLYVAPAASLLAFFLIAFWICRPLESGFILHGALAGVVGSLIYVAITRAQPEPFAYLVAHGLKIVGGAAGGFIAGRRRAATS